MSLRIFVAEDNEVIRSVICALLVAHPGWEICGEATDGADAVTQITKLKPDIILLDFDMPSKNGLEVTRELLQGWTSYKIIVLISTETELIVRDIFDAGARGFLVKSKATHDLIFAVDALQHGRTFFTPRFAESILKGRLGSNGDQASLTPRQRESVERLAHELTTTYRHQWTKVNLRHPLRKYAMSALLLLVAGAAGWLTYVGQWDRVMPELNELTVKAGLKPPAPAATYQGNPDRKVWIDVHTALYYCQDSNLYGRTRRGRFAKQIDAQADHYEPAGMKACD
jgi:Response regulator containing a CheY-like receiver domain and an HTH DNA-binding domain